MPDFIRVRAPEDGAAVLTLDRPQGGRTLLSMALRDEVTAAMARAGVRRVR